MKESIMITRQRLAQDLKAAQAKTVPVVKKLGAYDPVTGLSEVVSPDGGIGYGANLSNTAQPGDVMRVTRALGGVAALDNLSILSASGNRQKKPFPDPEFSAFKGDIFAKEQPKNKKVKWELQSDAIYDELNGIYVLTNADLEPYPFPPFNLYNVPKVGAICNRTRIKNPLFRFTFDFRIFGSTTDYFADGLAFSYVPSLIGAAGNDLGVGNLGDGFSCGVDTYFGEASAPMVKLFINSGAGYFSSGNSLSLRSSSWQQASVSVNINSLDVDFGGVSLSAPIPPPPSDYFLRISASNATYNDRHEVRNLLFNGKPLSGL